MKRVLNGAAALALALAVGGCGAEGGATSDLETLEERASYSVGMDIGGSLKQTGADFDLDALYQGIADVLLDRELKLSREEMAQVMQEFGEKVQRDQAAENAEMLAANLEEGAAFLTENATKAGVMTTPSGLQYEVMEEGDGPKPSATDRVSVHYRGTLLDETEFDSSYQRGLPATFAVNGVITGWTEALQLMSVGSKYRLFIPSELAYGEAGSPPNIGPHATLIFEVELLSIE